MKTKIISKCLSIDGIDN